MVLRPKTKGRIWEANLAATALACTAAVIGSLSLIGWFLRIPELIQVTPVFAPVQFNTALLFIFSSVGMLAHIYKVSWLSRLTGVFACLVAGLTLVQYVLNVNFGIDEFFFDSYITTHTSHEGRMSPNTALCFFAFNFAFLFPSLFVSVEHRLLFCRVLGMMVFIVGGMTLLGYIFDLDIFYGWGNASRMALLTSFGFVLLGLALIVHKPLDAKLPGHVHFLGLAFSVALVVLASFFLSNLLYHNEATSIGTQTTQAGRYMTNAFMQALNSRVSILSRMSRQWSLREKIPIFELNKQAEDIFLESPDVAAFFRIKNNGSIEWKIIKDPYTRLVGSDTLPSSWTEMKNEASPILMKKITVAETNYLVLVKPLILNSRLDGFLIEIIDLKTLIHFLFSDRSLKEFDLAVEVNGQQLFQSNGEQREPFGNWEHSESFQLFGNFWSLTIRPSQALISSELTFVPIMVLILGLFISGILALILVLFQSIKTYAELNRENQKRIQLILDTVGEGIFGVDARGKIFFMNKKAEAILGYSARDVEGKSVHEFLPFVSGVEKEACLKYLSREEMIEEFRNAEGEIVNVEAAGAPIRGLYGEYEGAVVTLRDVSEKKREEDVLLSLYKIASDLDLDLRKRLNTVLDASLTYLKIDCIGIGQYLGDAFKIQNVISNQVRLNEGDVIKLENDEAMDKDDVIADALKKETGYHDCHAFLLSVNRDFYGAIFFISLKERDDFWSRRKRSFLRLIAQWISHELTKAQNLEDLEKAHETELAKTVAALEEKNQELEVFAYAASHDLKAPLRTIANLASWLEEDLQGVLDDDSKENLQLLRSRVARMERLLGDLLAYSRVGRKLDREYDTQVNGYELVKEVVALLAPPSHFTVEIDEKLSQVTLNQMPLKQILLNLVSNALKHHDKEKGMISITVDWDETHYYLSVIDDGPGIPKKFHRNIFDIFETLKPRDAVEGSGLGLSIVEKQAKVFGGRIELESEEGQGAKFTVVWPKDQNQQVMYGKFGNPEKS